MTIKEKRNLAEKVPALTLSQKEKDLFWRLITKPMKVWSDDEIVILTLLYDAHNIPVFFCGGIDLWNDENAKNNWQIKFKGAREKVNNIFNVKSSSMFLPLSPVIREQPKVKPKPIVLAPLPPSPVIKEQPKAKSKPIVLPLLPATQEIKERKQIINKLKIPKI